jgi:hypothetical protein
MTRTSSTSLIAIGFVASLAGCSDPVEAERTGPR